jgi:hypothetical protein
MSQHESVVLCRHLHLHEDDLLHWSGAIVRLPTATAMLIQGWWGLAAAYATVAAPMVAGLVRGGAPLAKLLLSPIRSPTPSGSQATACCISRSAARSRRESAISAEYVSQVDSQSHRRTNAAHLS